MTTTVSSPTDVVNLSLVRLGHRWRVGNLYDGSAAAKLALDCYAQTRDETLRLEDWGFAERRLSMVLQKSAPIAGYVPPTVWDGTKHPPLGWLFQYAYPVDCLKVRSVRSTPLFLPVFDPVPVTFSIANDGFAAPAQRVILCNVINAVLTYTGQVTDPTTWDALFTEALTAALARRLSAALAANPEVLKQEAADEQAETMLASGRQG